MSGGIVGVALIGAVAPASARQAAAELAPFKQEIPSAALAIDMVPIPGDAARGIKPFWMSRTEVRWEAFDVFVYKLDEGGEQGSGAVGGAESGGAAKDTDPTSGRLPQGGGKEVDAVTRPSKPYLPPDRGFGHDGFAAITMSHACAAEFCKWLSARSGKKFRLATEDEWELACGPAPVNLAESAWFADNADSKPHHVGEKQPNARGLFDMLGNVAEWVDGRDGKPVVKGGSYRDAADQVTPTARQPSSRAWNASDPQIPKSKWWLADAPFVGFRIVCEPGAAGAEKKKEGSTP